MKKIKLKKRKNKLRIRRKIVLTSTLVLLLVLGIGYSALSVDLNINGDITVRKYYGDTLYKVLEDEAAIGTYAKEYLGDHQDSMDPTKSTEKVYHWYAENNTAGNSKANEILDKWNVIFGGFCWQMIRTTDTGGVKLLYSGVPNEGKCNNTGANQHIGSSRFNPYNNSLGYVGYMYNTQYPDKTKDTTKTIVLKQTSMSQSTNYYYGTGVTYSGGTYTLTGTTQATWSSMYSSSSGLYTCRSTTATTCSTVYYIVRATSYSMYGYEMKDGNLLNYYNTNLTLGTGYTESGGTYTLTGAITISRAEMYDNYQTYKNYYTCGDDSMSCSDINYITRTDSSYYYSISSANTYVFANDFTYNNGTYTLNNDRIESWKYTSTERTSLLTHHYTCFNKTGVCSKLAYISYASEPSFSSFLHYIELNDGKNVEDAKNEMLYNDNVNQIESDMKRYIDNWYSSNMTAYTDKLEDTIFCNNRAQTNADENEWNPNGGNHSGTMWEFLYYNKYSLTCENDIDRFSVSNNKAKLTYPIGLATHKEVELLNNRNLRKISYEYWLLSPSVAWAGETYVDYVDSNGNFLGTHSINSSALVRPVVSLKPFTKIFSGTGSKDDPYIVDNPYVYSISDTPIDIGDNVSVLQTTYTTPEAAATNFGKNTFLRHTVLNNIITGNSVAFVKDGTTYYIQGGGSTIDSTTGDYNSDSIYFDSNKQVMNEAFGSSNCSDHNTWYECSSGGLFVGIDAIGYIVFEDHNNGWNCTADAGGSGRCYSD